MNKETLSWLDEKINDFLMENVEIIPARWKKAVALYYPDARIRKKYLKELHVFMGNGTFSNLGLKTDATEDAPVIIGNNVSIAHNVTFITESNPNNAKELIGIDIVKERFVKKGKIVVEDDVWIGGGVIILPGVTIGKCSVVGAGAVVLKDIEPYTVYAGVPAKKIRDLK